MTREQRRRQLVQIGLQALVTTSFLELSVDTVAEKAGVTRSLLFHYFPTKNDYYLAVIDAACSHILSLITISGDLTDPHARINAKITALVRFISKRRENFIAVIGACSGVDPAMHEVAEKLRNDIISTMLTTCEIIEPSDWVWLQARAWLAGLEQMTILSSGTGVEIDEIINHLEDSFLALISAAKEHS